MSIHRRFVLNRVKDLTGISGTGIVAEGVQFSDGHVVIQWLGRWPTSVVWHDKGMESVEAVHGHGGATIVEWLDDEDGWPYLEVWNRVRQ